MENNQKTELTNLVSELTALGEDLKELGFWQDMFEFLNDDEKAKILENLRSELAELKKLKQK